MAIRIRNPPVFHKLSGIRNPQFQCRIRIPDSDSNFFLYCSDLLLPLKVNFYYFNIQIFMLLKLESESGIRNPGSGIRIRTVKNLHQNPESESADFLAGLPSLVIGISKLELLTIHQDRQYLKCRGQNSFPSVINQYLFHR